MSMIQDRVHQDDANGRTYDASLLARHEYFRTITRAAPSVSKPIEVLDYIGRQMGMSWNGV